MSQSRSSQIATTCFLVGLGFTISAGIAFYKKSEPRRVHHPVDVITDVPASGQTSASIATIPMVAPAVEFVTEVTDDDPQAAAASVSEAVVTPPAKKVTGVKPRAEPKSVPARDQDLDTDDLSRELIASADELLTEERQPAQEVVMAEQLGVPEAKIRLVLNREAALKRRLKTVELARSAGTRRLLINDHHTWLREYLGREKAERYSELNPNSLAR